MDIRKAWTRYRYYIWGIGGMVLLGTIVALLSSRSKLQDEILQRRTSIDHMQNGVSFPAQSTLAPDQHMDTPSFEYSYPLGNQAY